MTWSKTACRGRVSKFRHCVIRQQGILRHDQSVIISGRLSPSVISPWLCHCYFTVTSSLNYSLAPPSFKEQFITIIGHNLIFSVKAEAFACLSMPLAFFFFFFIFFIIFLFSFFYFIRCTFLTSYSFINRMSPFQLQNIPKIHNRCTSKNSTFSQDVTFFTQEMTIDSQWPIQYINIDSYIWQ